LRNEPWADVGRFAVFSRQITSLGLQPWESTVVYANTPEAHALLRRLKAAGLSRHEPDPVAACEATGALGCDGHSGSPACRNPSSNRERSSARR
jgi:hypothetical protein